MKKSRRLKRVAAIAATGKDLTQEQFATVVKNISRGWLSAIRVFFHAPLNSRLYDV